MEDWSVLLGETELEKKVRERATLTIEATRVFLKDDGVIVITTNKFIAKAIQVDLDDVLMGFTWKEVYKREDEYGMKARLLVWEEIIKQVLGDSRFSEGGG